MTSEKHAVTKDECFVYVVLPGQTVFVPAARFAVREDRNGVATGSFVYGRSYLERPNAVPLDPFDLPLSEHVHKTTRLKGLFGAIRDASPDYWGRRIIEKYGAARTKPSELDYLLQSPDDRAGALGFGLTVEPPPPRRTFNRTLDLKLLQTVADAVIAEEDLSQTADADAVQALLLAGTSMGGARPKVVVESDGALWIAKLNRPDDRWSSARVEHAMLTLARECGISAAESRLEVIGERDALLVKRFDREHTEGGYRRARMLSALTLLRAEDTHRDRDRWSYVLLAEELRRISARPEHDAHQLFRRMCFNALISNTDDHPRNHAVIAFANGWGLSPAYDLTPSTPVSIERRDLAMACGDFGRHARAQNLVSQCGRFLLEAVAAAAIVEQMERQVRTRWYAVGRSVGVTEKDCEKIAGAFVYDGFRLS